MYKDLLIKIHEKSIESLYLSMCYFCRPFHRMLEGSLQETRGGGASLPHRCLTDALRYHYREELGLSECPQRYPSLNALRDITSTPRRGAEIQMCLETIWGESLGGVNHQALTQSTRSTLQARFQTNFYYYYFFLDLLQKNGELYLTQASSASIIESTTAGGVPSCSCMMGQLRSRKCWCYISTNKMQLLEGALSGL